MDFGRVNGNLALSRAIGDFEFKKSAELSPEQQIVTAFPDVIAHTITDDDEFLVIACDGRCSDIFISLLCANAFQAYGIVNRPRLSWSLFGEASQQNKSCQRYPKT